MALYLLEGEDSLPFRAIHLMRTTQVSITFEALPVACKMKYAQKTRQILCRQKVVINVISFGNVTAHELSNCCCSGGPYIASNDK